jgi:hypothetical protein
MCTVEQSGEETCHAHVRLFHEIGDAHGLHGMTSDERHLPSSERRRLTLHRLLLLSIHSAVRLSLFCMQLFRELKHRCLYRRTSWRRDKMARLPQLLLTAFAPLGSIASGGTWPRFVPNDDGRASPTDIRLGHEAL